MFEYIKGRIESINAKYVVIDNNDIGYIVHVPNPYSFKKYLDEGLILKVYIYDYIREDIHDLYGFEAKEEKDLFIQLLSVKGIGPKSALAIIAKGEIQALQAAISSGDVKYFQRIPGIGAKSSGQIILDLKGKLVSPVAEKEDPKIKTVKDALKSLGYSSNELKKLDTLLNNNLDLSISELIKLSLKKL